MFISISNVLGELSFLCRDASEQWTVNVKMVLCVAYVDLRNSRQRSSEDQGRVWRVVDTRESNARQVNLASSHNWVRSTVC